MPTVRIRDFHGEFPRLNRRSIPEGGAQKARNVRFDSGDLRPFRSPLTDQVLTAGDIGYLFWYRHQDDVDGRYLTFGRDRLVHGFRSPVPEDQFRRWYWNLSRDSMRFISNPRNPTPAGAASAVGSGSTYRQFEGVPVGIPAPENAPIVANITEETAAGFGTGVTITSIARTNPVTINTEQEHGLEDGWRVRIKIDESLPKPQDQEGDGEGLPDEGDGEDASTVGQIWALEGAEGIVTEASANQFSIQGVSATSFTEFDQEDIDALKIERVFVDRDLEARSYVWTYVGQYGEEGPPSPASNIIDVPREGATVEMELSDTAHNQTVTGGSREYINRIRVYRAIGGTTGVSWLFVGELQFSGQVLPDDALTVSTLSWQTVGPFAGKVIVFLDAPAPEDYQVGDSIKIRSTSDSSFEFDTVIAELTNQTNDGPTAFWTELSADEIDFQTLPSGMYVTKGLGVTSSDGIEWISAPNAVAPQAWTANLIESVDTVALGDRMKSQGWFPPPNRMLGIAQLANGIIAGWKGNTIYFSDRYLPHAWDPDNRVTVEDEIVGAESFGNTLVVGTKTRPYVITGIDPSAMVPRKLEFHAPLLYKTAIADAGFGVLYVSHDGLVLVDGGGARYLTKSHFSEQEWLETVQGRDRVAYYDGLAFVYGAGKDPVVIDINSNQTEVSRVELDISAAAQKEGELAIVAKGPAAEYRSVQLFKKGAELMTGTWQSGLATFRRPINPAVAQVFAEGYPVTLTLRHVRPGSFPDPVAGEPDLDVLAENTYTVTGPEPFWLISGFLTREFEMEIEADHRVQEILVSTSMDELRRA